MAMAANFNGIFQNLLLLHLYYPLWTSVHFTYNIGKAKFVNSRNIHAFKFIGVPKQPCHDLMPHPNIWDSRGDISRTAPVGICTFTLLRVVDLWAPFAFFLSLTYTHHGGKTERTRVKCGIATKGEDRNSRKKKKKSWWFLGLVKWQKKTSQSIRQHPQFTSYMFLLGPWGNASFDVFTSIALADLKCFG